MDIHGVLILINSIWAHEGIALKSLNLQSICDIKI